MARSINFGVSFDIADAVPPTGVVAAFATAAACLPRPSESAVRGGAVNGVSIEALAQDAA
ncbi:hypothetical protein A4G26_26660 [Mycobacterium kansasii]|uniref:Uncharacterized protein n=1 Tax=Mycobacterium innocens TaxID=2341083 RepID=A0A498QCZ6_9MYCO|nr:hypothetical protein A4G26_26660 [Mycobacterium kansasii]VBA43191.1 hypothetical protein LAUMK13_04405 [Mycobacterium innocens]